MRALLRLACISLPVAATFACGSLDDPKDKKPLAVLEGQLTQAQSAPATPAAASNVRIAVVWLTIDHRGYESAQDIPAEAVFPSKFRLELTDPPPASAMIRAEPKSSDPPPEPPSAGPTPAPPPAQGGGGAPGGKSLGVRPADMTNHWPADFALAVGAVVAYEDVNGNGKLDLVDEGADSYVDRILGANEKMLLVYTEGSNVPAELTAPDGTTPAQGYNLLDVGDLCVEAKSDTLGHTDGGMTDPDPGFSDAGAKPCSGDKGGWRPMTTLYDLPLTAEPRFATIMCKNGAGMFGGSSEASGGGSVLTAPTPGPGPDGKYPAKNDPNLACDADGATYSYTKCTEISQGLCKGTITSCQTSRWGFPAGATTAPPDWPCPAK